MPNALELTGIRKSFDGFAALTDAHFELVRRLLVQHLGQVAFHARSLAGSENNNGEIHGIRGAGYAMRDRK